MKSLFEDITAKEHLVLSEILKHPNQTSADFFFDHPTIDGQVEELMSHHLVEITDNGILSITELGRAALIEYNVLSKQRASENRFRLLQFWIPTIIAIASLIVSIISLLH